MRFYTILVFFALLLNTCDSIKLFNIKFPKLIKKVEEKKETFEGII